MDVNKLIVDLVERDAKNVEKKLEGHIVDMIFQEISQETYHYLIENREHAETAREVLRAINYFGLHINLSVTDYLAGKMDGLLMLPRDDYVSTLSHILSSLIDLIGSVTCIGELTSVAFERDDSSTSIPRIEEVLNSLPNGKNLVSMFRGELTRLRDAKKLFLEIFKEPATE